MLKWAYKVFNNTDSNFFHPISSFSVLFFLLHLFNTSFEIYRMYIFIFCSVLQKEVVTVAGCRWVSLSFFVGDFLWFLLFFFRFVARVFRFVARVFICLMSGDREEHNHVFVYYIYMELFSFFIFLFLSTDNIIKFSPKVALPTVPLCIMVYHLFGRHHIHRIRKIRN